MLLIMAGAVSCEKKSEVKPADNSEEEAIPVTSTKGVAERTGGIVVRWVQLWKDGPKWAEYNVGATSVGGYGGYYAWSGSKDKEYYHYRGVLEDIQGGERDTAKKLWGDNWQMPTEADFYALLANCDVVWKSASESGYGVAGRLYTGKGEYADNSVFFPAAGYCEYGKVDEIGSRGYYWSSTPSARDDAYYLNFFPSSQSVFFYERHYCYSVRAILAK